MVTIEMMQAANKQRECRANRKSDGQLLYEIHRIQCLGELAVSWLDLPPDRAVDWEIAALKFRRALRRY